MTSQKLNQRIGWLIQREDDKICSLAKNKPVHLQNGGNAEVLFSLRANVERVLFTTSPKWRACLQIKYCYAPIRSRPIL